jgi:HEAT repeat protein
LLRRRIEKYRGPRDRGLAAVALGSLGLKKDVTLLSRLLDKSGLETRGFAALGLGILAREHDQEGKIAKLLAKRFKSASGNQRLRSALALSLGMTGNPDAGTFLLKAMDKTSNRIVRTYLAKALGMLRHRPAREPVLEAAIDAREPWVLRNTLLGYALLSDPVTGAELIPRFLSRGQRTERRGLAAAVALGGIGAEEALEPLVRYVKSGAAAAVNRAFVLEAIGLAGHLEGLPSLSRIARGHNFSIEAPVVDRVIRLRW